MTHKDVFDKLISEFMENLACLEQIIQPIYKNNTGLSGSL